jgi:hypothetical protein
MEITADDIVTVIHGKTPHIVSEVLETAVGTDTSMKSNQTVILPFTRKRD